MARITNTYWPHYARKNGWMQNPSRVKAPTATRKILPNTANTMSPGSRPKLVGLGLPAMERSEEPKASSMVVGSVGVCNSCMSVNDSY